MTVESANEPHQFVAAVVLSIYDPALDATFEVTETLNGHYYVDIIRGREFHRMFTRTRWAAFRLLEIHRAAMKPRRPGRKQDWSPRETK